MRLQTINTMLGVDSGERQRPRAPKPELPELQGVSAFFVLTNTLMKNSLELK